MKRRVLFVVQIALTVLISGAGAAGQASDTFGGLAKDTGLVVRSPNALLVLRSAVAAVGGAAIGQVRDCRAEGTSKVYLGHPRPAENLIIENAGAEYRYADSSGNVIVSGYGKPAAEDHHGKRTVLSQRTAWGNFSPHLLSFSLYTAL